MEMFQMIKRLKEMGVKGFSFELADETIYVTIEASRLLKMFGEDVKAYKSEDSEWLDLEYDADGIQCHSVMSWSDYMNWKKTCGRSFR